MQRLFVVLHLLKQSVELIPWAKACQFTSQQKVFVLHKLLAYLLEGLVLEIMHVPNTLNVKFWMEPLKELVDEQLKLFLRETLLKEEKTLFSRMLLHALLRSMMSSHSI